MLLLHAGELGGNLALWGIRYSGTHDGQRRAGGAVASKPFCASSDDLVQAIDMLVPDQNPSDYVFYTNVWTAALKKDRSGKRVHAKSLPGARQERLEVPVCQLPAAATVSLLSYIARRQPPTPEIVIGDDLAYWADVMATVDSMVVQQQQILQGTGNHGPRDAEAASPDGRAESLTAMAKRMPPLALALDGDESASSPQGSTRAALERVIAWLTDYLIRTSASRAEEAQLLQHGKHEGENDARLYTLTSLGADAWNDRARVAGAEPRGQQKTAAFPGYRLCFRLEEPEDPSDMWHVRYLLQSHDDPDVLIPADEAWETDVLADQLHARGLLQALLWQAAIMCRGIHVTKSGFGMGGHKLDSVGAQKFLAEEAPALEQAGYGVMLPDWWTGSGTRSRLTARANVTRPEKDGRLSLDTVVKFDWRVAIGDRDITAEDLVEIANMRSPLVKIHDTWTEVNLDDVASAAKFLRGVKKATLRDVVRISLGISPVPRGLDFGGINADMHITEMLERLESGAKMEDLGQPEGFSGTLRPYQIRGYSWMSFLRQWGLGGCLADDMGLGKTVQMLALLQGDWREGRREPVLLVCPTSVINNWRREAARFSPELPVMIHHGPGRKTGDDFAESAARHALVVSSYGLVTRDIDSMWQVNWGGLVLDEAQNIKNPYTKQAQAVRTIPSGYRFALTGTPVENNVGDLWSVMEFLNPGFLGSRADFRRNFFQPIQARRGPDAAETLRRATAPFVLRRLKTDKSVISDLPKKMEMKTYCTLTPEQAALYTSVLADLEGAIRGAEGMERKGLVLAAITRLKQVCNHPAHFLADDSEMSGRSGKLDRLVEVLEEVVAAGDKTLVFTQYVRMGHMLQRHLGDVLGVDVLFLHGGMTREGREDAVSRFQKPEGPPIFVVSLRAGGTGLNLTSANHVFHFDRWWNPAVENQATDRAFRIGQTRNVQIRKMICTGTLEETIDDMIEYKKSISESVVGSGEGWLTELSNEDLRRALALGRDAVDA